jgi:ketosteroid isomerase-like protein
MTMATRSSETEAQGTSKLRVVEAFFACVEHGDFDGMRARFAPDATVWHNNGQPEQTFAENLALVATIGSVVSGLRYDVVRRVAGEDGVFSQHVVRGELPDGSELRVDAVMFLRVANDRIHRIEEYFDSNQAHALFRAVADRQAG